MLAGAVLGEKCLTWKQEHRLATQHQSFGPEILELEVKLYRAVSKSVGEKRRDEAREGQRHLQSELPISSQSGTASIE